MKKRIGFVSASQVFPRFLTVAEITAIHRGLFPSWDSSFERRLADRFEIDPNEEVRQKVTVQQLLAHRAGIPSYWNDTYFDTKDSLKSIADFASAFSHLPLEFEPGSAA